MIVREKESGYEIIFQRNHALLAGELAMRVKPAFRPPHWVETLSSILEHDDGQTDWSDAEWITKEGRPLDYRERGFDLEQAKAVVHAAKHKSTWVHLMVSMHSAALCRSSNKSNSQIKAFLKEQQQSQSQLRKILSLRKHEVDNYYRFLRWCDECSLALCQGIVEETPSTFHNIGELVTGQTTKLKLTSDNSLALSPWCFEEETFAITAETYRIAKKKYANTEELRSIIDETRPARMTWVFKRNDKC